ncbi:MAG: hypothetical protein HQK78_18585, partial [Desulfobacterales bacterium]|nr:hypothetical protein [Desulfobacterales bacterium]
GMGYKEACDMLNIEPKQLGNNRVKNKIAQSLPEEFKPKEAIAPNKTWQEKAQVFFDMAVKELWNNAEKLEYLKGRGLTEETIKQAHLGYCQKDYFKNREDWGLETEVKENGELKKIWLPSGIVIPTFDNNELIRLRVRRLKEDSYGKYIMISGSSSKPMILGNSDIIFIVESELDAILLNQIASDSITSIALGSAQARPDKSTHSFLTGKHIVISLDADDVGAKESWQFWKKHFPEAIRYSTIDKKDIGEAYKNGVNLKTWIAGALINLGIIKPKQEQQNQHIPLVNNVSCLQLMPKKADNKSELIISLTNKLIEIIDKLDSNNYSYEVCLTMSEEAGVIYNTLEDIKTDLLNFNTPMNLELKEALCSYLNLRFKIIGNF